ncbi:MAG: SDR family NAD(P)-dependent oxidoreductase [Heliobacteriaceae bacterium]|jgi:NAD(P)-dependent dehydrogenase (short-subunit alcohol dehydrogenase family)|nr:SDR family NAD(P)-dependent oxidoreductase [Heliobacteriaceae bacterium]
MKTYVITGTTSGIGNALVKAFADDNIVFAGYRNEDFVVSLKKISPNVIPFYIDMSKKSSVRQAAAYIKSKLPESGKIDTIINAAGCVAAGAVENIDVDDVRKQFEVNTFSHLDFTQRLLPALEGKIINISSMSSFGIFPFVAPYCASKRALDILFNSLYIEKGIKVVSVKPGVTATALWEKSIDLNKKSIEKAKDGYSAAMEYMLANARKNRTGGLDVRKVADLILKIDACENPKPSYTIGADAKFAEILSKLPQEWINFIVKKGLQCKINGK